uniref:Uncharacterized protein n=1 Tax=Physcomitrium patens TaxID=3218 RepID=A0A7I4B3K1_PHYPA
MSMVYFASPPAKATIEVPEQLVISKHLLRFRSTRPSGSIADTVYDRLLIEMIPLSYLVKPVCIQFVPVILRPSGRNSKYR